LALVTGGNTGIGLEVGRQLARLDIQVILTARNKERGQTAVQQLETEGLAVLFHQLDVTEQNSVRRLVKRLADEYGRLDILVNNAGIFIDRGIKVREADLSLVRQTMETNFYGPLRLCQMLVPLRLSIPSGIMPSRLTLSMSTFNTISRVGSMLRAPP
jgi:NAD(P)-dependent dehydrogenase (short-subunit alcohol dehydrogenase family)